MLGSPHLQGAVQLDASRHHLDPAGRTFHARVIGQALPRVGARVDHDRGPRTGCFEGGIEGRAGWEGDPHQTPVPFSPITPGSTASYVVLASADHALLDKPVVLLLDRDAVLGVLAAGLDQATVRIVPVVGEELDLTENVSPSASVKPPTP